jgi:hypothetical protein
MNERTHIRCYEFTKCRCSVITKLGNPGRLPGDSRSLTVPGIAMCLGLEFASFPLTPALSPRRGRALARRWRTRTLRFQTALLCHSSRRHPTTRLGRITKARASVSPSPRGRGLGWGKQNTRSWNQSKTARRARRFWPFIISSLRLCPLTSHRHRKDSQSRAGKFAPG